MSQASSFPQPGSNAKEKTLFGHPYGLYVLFFTEMWERFSFYSMRAFLVFYMTKALVFSEGVSNQIYGAYLGFVYAATFVGGMLADRILGQRRAIIIGGCLMALAQFSLAAHSFMLPGPVTTAVAAAKDTGLFAGADILFFLGLGLLSAGNGFFKPNISTIVGSLYEQNDPRRDGAFTIFYMGINIGAVMAGFSGQAAETWGWHWGFLLAGSGMVLGQVIFMVGRRWLKGVGYAPTPAAGKSKVGTGPKHAMIALGVILFIPGAAYMMSQPSWVQDLALYIAVPIIAYLLWEAFRGTREERGRMLVIIILCGFSMMFWAFFELAGSAINLFTDQQVDRTVPFFGEIKASLLTASLNPFFIIVLGLGFAKLWVWLDKKQLEPSSPLKFSLGLLQLGAGFFAMFLGAKQAAVTGHCNIMYLVIGFMLHTTGELCLSPVGLSTITKLSPARFVGMFMGVWFLASALGNVFGGEVGSWSAKYGFETVFFGIAAVCAGAAVLLFCLTPVLKRMMHGVK